MGIKHRLGQAIAIIGAILVASALVYWINGMFLGQGTLAIYNALKFGIVGILFTIVGGSMVDKWGTA